MTGYPSIDKPWLKYYSDEAINMPLPEGTMCHSIERNNQGNLRNTALRYFGTKISYDSFIHMIHRAAAAYYSIGIRAGDIVTLMSMQTPETLASVYAINSLGATANMVYLSLSEKEVEKAINTTCSKALVVLDVVIDKIESIKDRIKVPVIVVSVRDSMPLPVKILYSLRNKQKNHSFISYKELVSGTHPTPKLSGSSNDPAVIVYTSGTTGDPKGVVLSNQNINCVAEQCDLAGKNYHPGESTFFYLPPFTGYGIAMLHLGLSHGIDFTIHLGIDTNIIAGKFTKARPNRIAGGPTLADAIVNHVTTDLSFMIDFTGGGEAISIEKERRINKFLKDHGSSAKYTTGYGMTEFASVVCMQTNKNYKEGSIGIPLPKANVKIINRDTGDEIGYHQIGEMCFTAPNEMLGYYKNEAATNDIIQIDNEGTRWIHTGDLGYVDEDGFVFFSGRLKRVYLVKDANGAMMKLFPQRIEDYLEADEGVESCGVVVIEDGERLHGSIAFITTNEKYHEENLLRKINEELPEHLRPLKIIAIKEMPLTVNGKIDYKDLEKLWKEHE